jgi:hypothetical protein
MDWRRLLQCAQAAATRHAAGTGRLPPTVDADDVAAGVISGASPLHALRTLQVRYGYMRVVLMRFLCTRVYKHACSMCVRMCMHTCCYILRSISMHNCMRYCARCN